MVSKPSLLARVPFWGIVAVVVAIWFWDVLLGVRSFYFRDFALFGYPLALEVKRSYLSGEIPFWNPYNNCGIPFLAQWNTMALYPGSLFCILLPMPWALNVFCVAHLVLGAFGMRRLLLKWTSDERAANLSGVLFAFNGFALCCLMWPNNVAAWGWMPWVVGACANGFRIDGKLSRRAMLIAGIVGAIQMLTGAPELIFFTWVIAGCVALAAGGFASGAGVVMAGVMSCALCAAQLLPFFELYTRSHRAMGFDTGDWAMPGWGLAHFFVPRFGMDPTPHGVMMQRDQNWTSSYYVGALTIALAGFGLRQRIGATLGAVALGGLVLALGIGGLTLFRFPIKFVVPVLFALVALAGLGVARAKGKGLWIAAGLVQAIILAIAIGAGSNTDIWLNAVARSVFLWAGAWLISSANPLAAAILPFVLIADLGSHLPWQNPTVEPEILTRAIDRTVAAPKFGEGRAYHTKAAYQALRKSMADEPAGDVVLRREALSMNVNLIEPTPKLDGFYSMYSWREREFRLALYFSPLTNTAPTLDFLGVTMSSNPERPYAWDPHTNPLPIVTIGAAPKFVKESAVMPSMMDPRFDATQLAFFAEELKTNAALAKLHAEPDARATVRSVSRHRIEADVSTDEPALAVMAQSYDPNWKASADGAPLEVFIANYNFHGVVVPAGAKSLVFEYRNRWFQIGCGISLGAAILCGVGMTRRKKA